MPYVRAIRFYLYQTVNYLFAVRKFTPLTGVVVDLFLRVIRPEWSLPHPYNSLHAV